MFSKTNVLMKFGFEFQAIYDYMFRFGCSQDFVKHQRYYELLTPPCSKI